MEGKDTLDLSGGKLTLTYNNGTTQVVNLTEGMVTGFDNTKVGPQALTVTYNGKTTTFEVEIIAKSLQSIAVTTLPTKTQYLEGKDALDLSGGKLTLTYNNGTTQVVDITDDMVTGFDNTKVGKQTLTVTYNGKTTTFEVEIIAKSLQSIAVTTLPTKTQYLEGKDTLDLSGSKLTLAYNNGTTQVVDITDDMATGFDNTKAGEQTITVTYQALSTTFAVEVNHDWEADFTTDQAPTCTTAGSKSRHCAYCGAKTDETAIPALGHSFTNYISNNNATCTENSTETAKCDRCGETDTREIANTALGHSYSADWTIDQVPTCTAAGSQSHHCTRCDAMADITPIPATGHSFGTWKVEKPATATEDGLAYRECSVCHEREEKILAAGEYITGDVDGDGKVTDKDVEYLLYYVVYPAEYPISQDCDFNKDGSVNDKDVEYLLYHIVFPDEYPLEINKNQQ